MFAAQVDWQLVNGYQGVMTPTTLLGVVIVISVSSWLIFRLRARFREDSGRADERLEMLSQFRDLRQQGQLTEDEYRLIKSRLARETVGQMAATSTGPQQSAVCATQPGRQEGGTEKTGETGQDDMDLRESRSTDEGPKLNSATESD